MGAWAATDSAQATDDTVPQSAPAAGAPPPWAFIVDPPGDDSAPTDQTPLHVPGSDRTYTAVDLDDSFQVADWHPVDHAPMPAVVAKGRRPAVFACGYCHLPNGAGRPENASLAGLPYDYILQQVAMFKSGARHAAVPARDPAKYMAIIAKAVRAAEVRAAARYFSRLPPQARVSVVETDWVPRTHVADWSLAVEATSPKEPIGPRIIEVPQSVEQFERRDSRVEYTAYVPVGSIQAGESLVRTGGANVTLPCTACHGEDLKGSGTIPRIVGRSTGYLVRQLYEFQAGFRSGAAVAPMTLVAKNLSLNDMIAIAAYLATQR
jgi:cytochrome c553